MHFSIGTRGVKVPMRDRFWSKVNKNGPTLVDMYERGRVPGKQWRPADGKRGKLLGYVAL